MRGLQPSRKSPGAFDSSVEGLERSAVRFLDRWFAHRTLRPYAVYCIIAGVVALVLVRTGVTVL